MPGLLPESDDEADSPITVRYYIDEAGTPTLFNARGQVIVGKDGCSTHFLLGKLDVTDPTSLDDALIQLRTEILGDPFFHGVPSLDPAQRKTAIHFHAKDDLPEIRDRVFHLLMEHDLRFAAVVHDKRTIVEEVWARNQADPKYRYRENEIYDELVSHLFQSGFHEGDELELTFAERGSKDRTEALKQAIENARASYEQKFGVKAHSAVNIRVAQPRQHGGLQAVDYFLWALQRFYERPPNSADDRYWELVRSKSRLIYDKGDTREHSFGRFYTPDKPLTRGSRGA